MRRPLCSNIMDTTGLNQNLTTGGEICSQEAATLPLSKTRVFGVSLETLRSCSEMAVPHVLTRICNFIESNALGTEGLFVQNGESCLIDNLKSLFDQSGDAPLETVDVASVAQLLKIFFKELPEPLIPLHLHPAIFRGLEVSGNNREDWTRHLKSTVVKLSNTSFSVLKYLSHFFLRVACHENLNGTSQDLGSIFGPILFGLAEDIADPLELSLSREVVRCFMADYQAIFEGDAELSCTEDVPVQLVSHLNHPVRIMASTTGRAKMSPMPSSVMPLVPLEPLSVVIPPDNRTLQDDIQDAEMVGSVPVLLVESFRYDEDTNVFSKGILVEDANFQREDKLGNNYPPRRKRKERRPSGEDLQPPRSSSEERPPPCRTDELFVKGDQMRRCSSHEEMKMLARVAWENGLSEEKVREEEVRPFGSPTDVTLTLKPSYSDLRDHSPHPPKPKRREIDSSEILLESQNQQGSQFDEPQDYHEIQRNNERFTTFHWSSFSRSRYASRSFKCSCSRKSITSEIISKKITEDECIDDSDISDMRQDMCLDGEDSNTPEKEKVQEPCDTSTDNFSNWNFCPLHTLAPQNGNPYTQERRSQHGLNDGKLSHPLLEQHPVSQEQSEEGDEENGFSMDESSETTDTCTAFIPPLDFTTLHEHDGEPEPIRSEHRHSWPLLKVQEDDALLSPSVHHLRKSNSYEAPLSPSAYRSYLSYRSMHFDPNVPPSPPVEQDDFGKSTLKEEEAATATMKQLTKRIHSLKKKIRHFEELFENEHGYRPSHAEKMGHHDIKKLLSDLNKARKELKSLKEEAQSIPPITPLSQWFPTREVHVLEDTTNNVSTQRQSDGISCDEAKAKPSIEELLDDALNFLFEKRRLAQRPEAVEDMTKDQITEEKLAIQKALLHFESIHGRPSNKWDRDVMRPLYDRYRSVKRVLVRSSSLGSIGSKTKEPGTELQPILEHETMNFTSPQHRSLSLEPLSSTDETPIQEVEKVYEEFPPSQIQETEEIVKEVDFDEANKRKTSLQYLATKYNNSNLHELPLSELLFQQQHARSEKRRIRRVLRDFEEEFQKQTGRKVQKEDRTPMETVYAEYKHVKARLRLLEALVSKHEQHKFT